MQIEVKNIVKTYKQADGIIRTVFNNLSYSFSGNDITTIIGPNGSGKSTLLNLMAGVEKPDAGLVILKSDQTEHIRTGYVWQDYRSALMPHLNVWQNIAFPLKLQGVPKDQRREIAKSLLNQFNVSFGYKDKVYKLSGGQQQLVNLLRDIAAAPDLLFCDEPFSNLDQFSRWTMAFYLEKEWLRRPIPMLFVTHDPDECLLLGSRVILINKKGEIEDVIVNDLPRPRSIDLLSSPKHIELRKKIIDFMKENGAITDKQV